MVLGWAIASPRPYSMGRAGKFAGCAEFPVEPEDRFTGRRRSPQQAPPLETTSGKAISPLKFYKK